MSYPSPHSTGSALVDCGKISEVRMIQGESVAVRFQQGPLPYRICFWAFSKNRKKKSLETSNNTTFCFKKKIPRKG